MPRTDMTPAGGNTRGGVDAAEIVEKCRECGELKALSEFVRDRTKKWHGGFARRCRGCDAERSKRYYQRVRDQKLARMAERRVALRGTRVCAWEGCERESLTSRNHYCGEHVRASRDRRLQRRGEMSPERLARSRDLDAKRSAKRKALGLTAAARGYDLRFVRLKEWWRPRVEAGTVICWRCGELIAVGAEWDLGHDDHDRSIIRGPEHQACNRSAAAKARNAGVRRAS
jgi:hypothetical protein